MATRERQPRRKKQPSFSSSLLDSIYQSIDEQEMEHFDLHRKNNSVQVKNEIQSFRRALMIEKWMENYRSSSNAPTSRLFASNSGSSTDSSMFSSSKSTSKSSAASFDQKQKQKQKQDQIPVIEKPGKILQSENRTNRQGRFSKTKLCALKIYEDLKKVKEPISPGCKITNFLNSIFSPRKLKKNQVMEEWSSMRKSRSIKDTKTCSLASRSCLRKTPRGNKSKRSVRFCLVNAVVYEDPPHVPYQYTNTHLSSTGLSSIRPQKSKYGYDYSCTAPISSVGCQFIKKNIESSRLEEVKNLSKHGSRYQFYENESESDLDNKSCTSSDLFELDHTVRFGTGNEEGLPVYGTTRLEAIAGGFVM
ncbi:Hypothetical predicted protein [Olea europaea subsp. europaea]|uniref:Protein BIG GRAIN 1-like B n=1 Tax=Olea europaea subsp. europaea TaxID=158383 RepID=A0A8S0T6T9_OLEEU|nr:Hypothetical predicted protein [Olea europaea subsp. europaea]